MTLALKICLTINEPIGMGYVNRPGLTAAKIAEAKFQIEIARERFSAKASLRAFYDPAGRRMKA